MTDQQLEFIASWFSFDPLVMRLIAALENEHAQNRVLMGDKDRSGLLIEIRRLRAALKKYGRHGNGCFVQRFCSNDPEQKCTCGFAKEIELCANT